MSTSTQTEHTRDYFQTALKARWPLAIDLQVNIDMVFDEVKSRKTNPTMSIQALVCSIVELHLSAIDMLAAKSHQHEVIAAVYNAIEWLVSEIE